MIKEGSILHLKTDKGTIFSTVLWSKIIKISDAKRCKIFRTCQIGFSSFLLDTSLLLSVFRIAQRGSDDQFPLDVVVGKLRRGCLRRRLGLTIVPFERQPNCPLLGSRLFKH